jgi:hypoxanthine phosphoribosyltransferase
MEKDIERILITAEELKERVTELGAQISRDYAGKTPLIISILRGSYIFMADLTRSVTIPCVVDFMAVSSYGSGSVSSGKVRIVKDLSEDVAGRDVLVVEDILDSGNTLGNLIELLKARKAGSIRLCTLLDKPERRVQQVSCDYVGFTIPDHFVVGYGLDYAEKYRNLPYIGILKPSIYQGE